MENNENEPQIIDLGGCDRPETVVDRDKLNEKMNELMSRRLITPEMARQEAITAVKAISQADGDSIGHITLDDYFRLNATLQKDIRSMWIEVETLKQIDELLTDGKIAKAVADHLDEVTWERYGR